MLLCSSVVSGFVPLAPSLSWPAASKTSGFCGSPPWEDIWTRERQTCSLLAAPSRLAQSATIRMELNHGAKIGKIIASSWKENAEYSIGGKVQYQEPSPKVNTYGSGQSSRQQRSREKLGVGKRWVVSRLPLALSTAHDHGARSSALPCRFCQSCSWSRSVVRGGLGGGR